jgi:hypothetical protein
VRKFYNRIKINRAIVVPNDDLFPIANKYNVPCFTIIEEPFINLKRAKEKDGSGGKKKEKNTEVAGKIVPMSPINLIWNVTKGRLQSPNKIFKQSEAVNIRKYRGGANEKLIALTSQMKKDTGGLSNGDITSDIRFSVEKVNHQNTGEAYQRGNLNSSGLS